MTARERPHSPIGPKASLTVEEGSASLRSFETRRLELEVRMEEFKALRSEIVSTLSAAYLTTNLTLVAAGLLCAAIPVIEQLKSYYLFALASLAFSFLSWTQLRCVLTVFNMSQHIAGVVAPGVRSRLLKLDPSRISDDFDDVLTWEVAGRTPNHSSDLIFLPIEAARYGIPLAAAAAAALLSVVTRPAGDALNFWDWTALAADICLIAYSATMTLIARRRLRSN